MRILRRLWLFALICLAAFGFTACSFAGEAGRSKPNPETEHLELAKDSTTPDSKKTDTTQIKKDGEYTGKEEVALYIHTYGKLPSNFITKKEAEALGWDNSEGNLDDVAPGKSIGGSRFGNYEGSLPKGNYKECDINYTGGYRGAERLIYSDDGAVYYTGDHYKTFEQLY